MLDRGWGKPTDRVENVGRINTFDGVSDDELRAMIAVVKEGIAAGGGVPEIEAKA